MSAVQTLLGWPFGRLTAVSSAASSKRSFAWGDVELLLPCLILDSDESGINGKGNTP